MLVNMGIFVLAEVVCFQRGLMRMAGEAVVGAGAGLGLLLIKYCGINTLWADFGYRSNSPSA